MTSNQESWREGEMKSLLQSKKATSTELDGPWEQSRPWPSHLITITCMHKSAHTNMNLVILNHPKRFLQTLMPGSPPRSINPSLGGRGQGSDPGVLCKLPGDYGMQPGLRNSTAFPEAQSRALAGGTAGRLLEIRHEYKKE